MATALLISGQVKATTATVTDETSLHTALTTAGVDKIVVNTPVITLTTKPIVIYDKTLELDLNGNTITTALNCAVYMVKGNLNISGKEGSKIECTFNGWITSGEIQYLKNDDVYYGAGIRMLGSTNSTATNFTTVTVGQNVKIIGSTRGIELDKVNALDQGNLKATKWGYNSVETYINGALNGQYGMTLNVNGTIEGGLYGVQIMGNVNAKPASAETDLAPFTHVNIYESAKVTATLGKVRVGTGATAYKFGTGIYSSGWGVWLIKGTVSGSNGLYVKSSQIVIDGANISGIGQHYDVAGNVAGAASGTTGGGNAITIESAAGYAGEMNITITGDTKLSSEQGYTIEETIITKTSTEVEALKILSGTFVAPEGQTVKITDETKIKRDSVYAIGGSFTDDEVIQLGLTGNNGFYTESNDGTNDVFVIGQKPAGTNWMHTFTNADANSYVDFDATSVNEEVEGNLTIAYLRITAAKTITVKTGAVLTVGEAVIGDVDGAKIIVEAGGKLKITGDKGILVPTVDQLVLEANATDGMGMLVFKPTVQSNKTPFATMQYVSNSQMDDFGRKWEIVASPFAVLTDFTSDWTNAEVTQGYSKGTTMKYYDAANGWTAYASLTDLKNNAKAFSAIAISNPSVAGGVVYTFKGQLQGNVTGSFDMKEGWNYIGNGWAANLSTDAFKAAITASGKVDPTMYIWNFGRQGYDFGSAIPAQLPAISFIAIKSI